MPNARRARGAPGLGGVPPPPRPIPCGRRAPRCPASAQAKGRTWPTNRTSAHPLSHAYRGATAWPRCGSPPPPAPPMADALRPGEHPAAQLRPRPKAGPGQRTEPAPTHSAMPTEALQPGRGAGVHRLPHRPWPTPYGQASTPLPSCGPGQRQDLANEPNQRPPTQPCLPRRYSLAAVRESTASRTAHGRRPTARRAPRCPAAAQAKGRTWPTNRTSAHPLSHAYRGATPRPRCGSPPPPAPPMADALRQASTPLPSCGPGQRQDLANEPNQRPPTQPCLPRRYP
ncbi:hypothetical protein EDD35_2187 [Amycolatopsis thermoflava]|uniref:Uncharacterized protein n=1 Tax=Amycolatopsis thermoflava TaxID=84480 RepID=A0A3N2GT95_9PSEU|nr:hypothetical protein EDD35_2187 [Amycolatopsis thermoflava]